MTLDLGADTDELDSGTVSNLAADNETTVTLSWDTTGETAGDHSVRALAETDGDGNSENDSATVTVTLESPAPDVAVKSVAASKSQAVVGETVDFTVTLENDGNVPAVTPAVSLFDADEADDAAPLASATANTIAVDDETTVKISWDTDDVAAGEYSLRVDARDHRRCRFNQRQRNRNADAAQPGGRGGAFPQPHCGYGSPRKFRERAVHGRQCR